MEITSQMTDKQLRKDIYKLRRELREDLSKVRQAMSGVPNFPNDAVDNMKSTERTMRKTTVKNMSRRQLQTTLRDLRYIRNLKTSTVAGALDAYDKMKNVWKLVENLSEEQAKDFWDIYKHLYQGTQSLADRYKYDILDVLQEQYQNKNIPVDLLESVKKLLVDVGLEVPKDAEDSKRTVLFASKFKELFQKP